MFNSYDNSFSQERAAEDGGVAAPVFFVAWPLSGRKNVCKFSLCVAYCFWVRSRFRTGRTYPRTGSFDLAPLCTHAERNRTLYQLNSATRDRGPGNNERAWRTFLQRYKPSILDWCLKGGLQHDDAETVSTDVLVKLAKKMETFDRTRCFRNWLWRVVRNAVRDFQRRVSRLPHFPAAGGPAFDHFVKNLSARGGIEELVEHLDRALEEDLKAARQIAERVKGQVKAHRWQAFWWTVIDDRPAAEVAEELGMSVADVYVTAHRVGKLLRKEGANWQGRRPGSE